ASIIYEGCFMKLSRGSSFGLLGVLAVSLLVCSPGFAASFSSSNNLVVIRVGSSSETPDFDIASSVHLQEYSNLSSAKATLVQTIDLPTTGASAFTLPFSSNHDGVLNRSVDGHYLVFGGYEADVGTGDLSTSNSSSAGSGPVIPRVIARVGAN